MLEGGVATRIGIGISKVGAEVGDEGIWVGVLGGGGTGCAFAGGSIQSRYIEPSLARYISREINQPFVLSEVGGRKWMTKLVQLERNICRCTK